MNRSIRVFSFAAMLTALAAIPAGAQQKDASADLKARAKITEAAAVKTALELVPDGKVTLTELSEERGNVIYTVDVKQDGAEGVERVQVDATTGKVISKKHEKDPEENC